MAQIASLIDRALLATLDSDEVVAMISVAKEEAEEAPAADISAIEISEERGKKPEEAPAGAETEAK